MYDDSAYIAGLELLELRCLTVFLLEVHSSVHVIPVCMWRRYMVNASLFGNLSDEAQLVRGTKVAVGGNAPVMVNSFRREGVRVLLGAQMTEDLRRMIDPEVEGTVSRWIYGDRAVISTRPDLGVVDFNCVFNDNIGLRRQ